MRTIVAGSRDNISVGDVHKAIRDAPWTPSVVVSGNARGVDKFGEIWATENEVPVEKHPAQWGIFGKSAGYIRNAEMASNAEALIAVWDGSSRGTEHMINTAKQRGLKVYVHKVTKEK
jgi:hypothetical protein